MIRCAKINITIALSVSAQALAAGAAKVALCEERLMLPHAKHI